MFVIHLCSFCSPSKSRSFSLGSSYVTGFMITWEQFQYHKAILDILILLFLHTFVAKVFDGIELVKLGIIVYVYISELAEGDLFTL